MVFKKASPFMGLKDWLDYVQLSINNRGNPENQGSDKTVTISLLIMG
jgi:hypothetical protein